jgi:orotate phosphoribosyltransferase
MAQLLIFQGSARFLDCEVLVKSAEELRSKGAVVDTVLCVIQRDQMASEILRREKLSLISAFTMDFMKAQI